MGPYMTDVIGKCLRQVNAFSGNGPSRGDKYLLSSATYKAAVEHRDLKSEFDSRRAEKGYLIWQESRKQSVRAYFPIEVDATSGVVRQMNADVYGLLVDVRPCLHRKGLDGEYVPWDSGEPLDQCVAPTQQEIDSHDSSRSTFGTRSRGGRVQQAEWSERVAKLWDYRCAVTGCDQRALLDAAHILPHRDGTTEQRLDEQNGIYMAAHLHRAFDRGLISFSEQGVLLYSPTLSAAARKSMGLPEEAKLPKLPPRTAQYLRDHRARFEFD